MTSGLPPWLITAGPDGNMWFTQNANPGGIGRITVPPGVKDHNAQHVDFTTANFRAKIRANAQDTYYYFEYGPTEELGSQTETAYAGNGWKAEHFEAAVSGLTQDTTYYFRPVATNDAGTTIGDTRSFHTKSPLAAEGGGSSTETETKPEFAELVVAAAHEGHDPVQAARRAPLAQADLRRGAAGRRDRRQRGPGASRSPARVAAAGFRPAASAAGVFSIHQPRTGRAGAWTFASAAATSRNASARCARRAAARAPAPRPSPASGASGAATAAGATAPTGATAMPPCAARAGSRRTAASGPTRESPRARSSYATGRGAVASSSGPAAPTSRGGRAARSPDAT